MFLPTRPHGRGRQKSRENVEICRFYPHARMGVVSIISQTILQSDYVFLFMITEISPKVTFAFLSKSIITILKRRIFRANISVKL